MGEVLNILYQSDDNYAVYLGVSMLSLFMNNKDAAQINVYVIDDSIAEKNKKKLADTAESFGRTLIFKEAAALHEKAEGTGFDRYNGYRKNKMSYLKMFVSDVVPAGIKRLLYIDCDTLVTGSLLELMEADMDGKVLGMVQSAMAGARGKKMIGLAPEDPYYNSGVILFDMDLWREEKCLEQIIDHAKHVRIYRTVDQDFYNVVLKGRIKTLGPRYNLQGTYLFYERRTVERFFPKSGKYYSGEEVAEAIKDPAIMHFFRFLGQYPMDADNIHPAEPEFEKYRALSAFADVPKKPCSLKPMIKAERMLYRHLPHSLFLPLFNMANRINADREEKKCLEISAALRELSENEEAAG